MVCQWGLCRKAFVWCVQKKTFVWCVQDQKGICMVCQWGWSRKAFVWFVQKSICMACPEKHLYGVSVKVKSGEIGAGSICHPMLPIFNLPEILKKFVHNWKHTTGVTPVKNAKININKTITDGGVALPTWLLTIVMMSSDLRSLRISRNAKDSREG